MSTETIRPEGITDQHLEYLDELRESGVTNMFGAASYIVDEFGTPHREAKDILGYWMRTFGNPDR